MKKSLITISLILLIISAVAAKPKQKPGFKLAESEQEFDVLYLVDNVNVFPSEPIQTDVIPTTQALNIDCEGIQAQIRFTLYKDTGIKEKDIEDTFIEFGSSTLFLLSSNEEPSVSFFPPESLKTEFNADMGFTVMIKDTSSPYFDGYKYAILDVFYKNGQGAVVRTTLFNDIRFATEITETQLPLHFRFYHNFRFLD